MILWIAVPALALRQHGRESEPRRLFEIVRAATPTNFNGALSKLAMMPDEEIAGLEEFMKGRDSMTAYTLLLNLPPSKIGAPIKISHSKHPWARLHALEVVARIGSAADGSKGGGKVAALASLRLINALYDADPYRYAASTWLAYIGSSKPMLLRQADFSRSAAVRALAARTLVLMDYADVPFWIRKLNVPDRNALKYAVEGLKVLARRKTSLSKEEAQRLKAAANSAERRFPKERAHISAAVDAVISK